MTTTELVPIQETVALPITVEQAHAQWEQYQDLCRKLLDPTDYQSIGGKQFKKKSGWRKLSRAFNIADRVTFEHIERADDGFPLWARIRVEASHPNGRTTEADHECHIGERCCGAARGQRCTNTSKYHQHCAHGCDGRIHWSHPGDIPATALTRAKNRAISDLIGAGEVSAEEMDGQRPVEQQQPVDASWQDIPEDGYDEPYDEPPPPAAPPAKVPARKPPSGALPSCPKCGGPVWDNRGSKPSPKSPDFKCKGKGCDTAGWLREDGSIGWK